MSRQREFRMRELVRAPLVAFGFILKMMHKALLGWWLDPWLQRRANRRLLDDVRANFYSVLSEGQITNPKRTAILPFDYSSVRVIYKNISFCFTRGRGGVHVSLSPRHAPTESYELGSVVAALDHRHLSEHDMVNDLEGAASLLYPRLDALNTAFSEHEFPRFRIRL